MKIARVADRRDSHSWVVVEPEQGSARRITGDIATWGPAVTDGQPMTAYLQEPEPLEGLTLLPPVEPTGRVFGVGANYRVHLARFGVDPPEQPASYIKPLTALVAADQEIHYPATTSQLDFEVELVLVIGKLAPSDGPLHRCVLGCTIGNDVSARDAARGVAGIDLFSMKALDRTTPVGPWITTHDELGDLGSLDVAIALSTNGEERQRDHTAEMIFDIESILGFIHDRVAILPGDLIFTGTTAGVGMEDGRFLVPGDEMVASIEGIGELHNVVGPRSAAGGR